MFYIYIDIVWLALIWHGSSTPVPLWCQAFPEGQWTCKMRNPMKFEVTKQGVLNELGKTVQEGILNGEKRS